MGTSVRTAVSSLEGLKLATALAGPLIEIESERPLAP